MENSDKGWSWSSFSQNISITLGYCRKKNLDKPWDWWYLSINSNITMDIVKKYG